MSVSQPFFFLKSGHRLFILFICVCILGHAKPQNWFNPGDGGGLCSQGCILLYLVKVPSWNSYTIGCMPPKAVPILSCVKAWAQNHHFTVFIMIRISQTHFFFLKEYVRIWPSDGKPFCGWLLAPFFTDWARNFLDLHFASFWPSDLSSPRLPVEGTK